MISQNVVALILKFIQNITSFALNADFLFKAVVRCDGGTASVTVWSDTWLAEDHAVVPGDELVARRAVVLSADFRDFSGRACDVD